MNIEEHIEAKSVAVETLRSMLCDRDYLKELEFVDERLRHYVSDVSENDEFHNIYEVLGVIRFLRYCDTYYLDASIMRKIFLAMEGEWGNIGGSWRHIKGGFEIASQRGFTHYRLTPLQVYIYTSIYGFHYYYDLGEYDGKSELLESECVSSDNHLLDYRRVITEADIFIPRKNGKSDLASNFVILDMMGITTREPDGQDLLCANSRSQSEIVFKMARQKVEQLDPKGQYIRQTASQMNWKPFNRLKGEIIAQTSGGKTKDGLKASLVVADEMGSAYYVKERSDMVDLVNVCRSSMGTRRQPLFIATTTAGLTIGGPYEKRLDRLMKSP